MLYPQHPVGRGGRAFVEIDVQAGGVPQAALRQGECAGRAAAGADDDAAVFDFGVFAGDGEVVGLVYGFVFAALVACHIEDGIFAESIEADALVAGLDEDVLRFEQARALPNNAFGLRHTVEVVDADLGAGGIIADKDKGVGTDGGEADVAQGNDAGVLFDSDAAVGIVGEVGDVDTVRAVHKHGQAFATVFGRVDGDDVDSVHTVADNAVVGFARPADGKHDADADVFDNTVAGDGGAGGDGVGVAFDLDAAGHAPRVAVADGAAAASFVDFKTLLRAFGGQRMVGAVVDGGAVVEDDAVAVVAGEAIVAVGVFGDAVFDDDVFAAGERGVAGTVLVGRNIEAVQRRVFGADVFHATVFNGREFDAAGLVVDGRADLVAAFPCAVDAQIAEGDVAVVAAAHLVIVGCVGENVGDGR